MSIRPITPEDVVPMAAIYNYYVANTVVTFDLEPVSVDAMAQKADTIAATYPYLALDDGEGRLAGYAYGSQFRPKPGYRFTVETTIYFDPSCTGNGYGTALYTALLSELRDRGFKTAVAVLVLPNAASARLHEKLGFVKIGHIPNAGRKFDRWLDTGYWHLDLETLA